MHTLLLVCTVSASPYCRAMRAILDYNGLRSNATLVARDRTKHVRADVLLTYLLTPHGPLRVAGRIEEGCRM